MKRKWVFVGLAVLTLAVDSAPANNLQVTNVTVSGRDDSTAYVNFDITWENSWRYTNINHDAAWVFFKVLPEGSNAWQHVKLEGSGTNPTDYATGTGTGIEIGVPSDRVGLFVRRSVEGSGTTSVRNVKAVWNFASNSLTKSDMVRMQVLALEMVFVAEGAFAAGSGGSESSAFTLTTINTNKANVVPSGSGSLGGQAGGYPTGQTAPNVSWPNGYAAFYSMKYEITQGQYTDFLNTLTSFQATSRYSSVSTGSRYTIGTNTVGVYINGAPDRACNFLSWADGCAFADWAGLRPMTELEFEKACRGPLTPVANEYAWGNTTLSATTAIGNDGTGTDTATGGNCNYDGCSPDGPFRVGIYATASSSRVAAGASYWGIMELSGNLWERTVTIGVVAGRAFTGQHGNGELASDGNANVTAWPGTSADGSGFRGSGFSWTAAAACVSDRASAATIIATRANGYGFRAVRAVPSGAGP